MPFLYLLTDMSQMSSKRWVRNDEHTVCKNPPNISPSFSDPGERECWHYIIIPGLSPLKYNF